MVGTLRGSCRVPGSPGSVCKTGSKLTLAGGGAPQGDSYTTTAGNHASHSGGASAPPSPGSLSPGSRNISIHKPSEADVIYQPQSLKNWTKYWNHRRS